MGQGKRHHFHGFAPLLLLLLILHALPLFPLPRSIDIHFRTFGIEAGISADGITTVFIDRRGFLWLGTLEGLNCFDGYSFRHYRHRPGKADSLNDNFIYVMHDDRLGRMWVRTRKGLEILDPITDRVIYLGQPEVPVCSLEETASGEMWIGTENGEIFIRESASGRMLSPPAWLRPDLLKRKDGKTYNPVAILEEADGNIWIGCRDKLLYYAPTTGRISSFGGITYFTTPIRDEHGLYWIAHNTGLSCLDPARETLRHFLWPERWGKDLSSIGNLSHDIDPDGLIWVGAIHGLTIFDCKKEKFIDSIRCWGEPRNSILKDIQHICKDPAGNMWLGIWQIGLCRISRRANLFQLIGDPPDVATSCPYSLLEDRDGNIWSGTIDSGLIIYGPESSSSRHISDPLTITQSSFTLAKSIFSLCEDSSGDIWIGAANGLFRHERQGGTFQRFDLPPKLPPSPFHVPRVILSIREEGPDSLWILSRDEGVFRIDKKLRSSELIKTDEIMPPGLYPRRLERLFLDRSRTLWVCSGNGIHRLDRASGRFDHFLTGNRIFNALEDSIGNFWASSDFGLILMDRRLGTFKVFSKKHGLVGDSLYCLAEDNDGCIWIGNNRGLACFDPRRETFKNFDLNDGIGPVYCISSSRDGRMLAGCSKSKGLLAFDPREVVKSNTHVPPVFVTSLRIGDRDVPLHEAFSRRDQVKEVGKVTLRPGDRLLSVEFAALDFTAPEKNRYAFRIEEQGEKWNDLGTRRQLTFSNLAVGTHTLRVKGCNNDGVWNETGVALRIEVLPAFWQTWWFKLLCLLLLAGISLAIVAVCRTISSLRKIAKPPNLDEIFRKHNISHREQEILHLVIQGKSNREMENELFISVPTVKRHLANIYEKIGVSSRLQLINFLQGRKPRY